MIETKNLDLLYSDMRYVLNLNLKFQFPETWRLSRTECLLFETHLQYLICKIKYCCDMTLSAKIELIHFSVLSDRDLNCHYNIQLLLQQCEKLRVNGDTD